jgi:hypothetical protein
VNRRRLDCVADEVNAESDLPREHGCDRPPNTA